MEEAVMSRLDQALEQLNLARTYPLELLSDIPEKDWFRMPDSGVTHIAWQAGHLAAAQYSLALSRMRGTRPEDRELFPNETFVELFGRTSTPLADAGKYPTPSELLATLERIIIQIRKELPAITDAQLDEPTASAKPHPIVTTKLSSLLWCAHHEFLHAGQIGLLRRMLGATAKW
jgi:hypothetical protein